MLVDFKRRAGSSKLTIESHDPVHNERASFETPRQLTRLSCPCKVPTRSPRRTSQTYDVVLEAKVRFKVTELESVPCIRSHRNQRRADDLTQRKQRK